jgi:hypothetical protein
MTIAESAADELQLSSLRLELKALFTGYILVVGLGLLVAGGQILLTHGMADGKFGLSIDDIVYSYYGNRGNSRLEAKLNGSMKDKAPIEDRTAIIRWVHEGSSIEAWDKKIGSIVQSNCTSCHGVIPGLPDFNSYSGVKALASIDTGASIDSLTRVSHIHLFGISFIFFFVGWIFSYASGISGDKKAFLIIIPFVFLFLDITAWWLTKWYPGFAWATLIGGVGYSIASSFMLLCSLYQMWLMPLAHNSQN